MSSWEFRSLWPLKYMGKQYTKRNATSATRKEYVHDVNPSAKPSVGNSQQFRRLSKQASALRRQSRRGKGVRG